VQRFFDKIMLDQKGAMTIQPNLTAL